MAVQDAANATNLQLEKVRKKLPVLFERDGVFASWVEKKPVEIVSNRDMRIPVEKRPGGKFRHVNIDGGGYGRGDGAKWDKATINCVHVTEAIEYTTLADVATNKNEKAIEQAVNRLIATAMDELRRNVDSELMVAGTGVAGTTSAYSVGTGTNGGDVLTFAGATDGFGARLIRDGCDYSVYDTTLATNKSLATGPRTVVFYDGPNKIVHITPSLATGIAGDRLVFDGLTGANPVSILGVPYHHAITGTWLGFNRANEPNTRSNRVAAGGALALSHGRLALNRIGDRVGLEEGVKAAAWMHPSQVQAYEELGQAIMMINKQAKAENMDLYFDPMNFAGAPIKKSFSWDKQRIDFVIGDTWGRAEMYPAGYKTTRDGRKMFEVRDQQGGVAAAEIFYLVWGGNYFIDNPARTAFIDTLSIVSGY